MKQPKEEPIRNSTEDKNNTEADLRRPAPVPKAELERREAEYKKQRKTKKNGH